MPRLLLLFLTVAFSHATHANETKIFGLIVSEPAREYTEGAQPLAGVPVTFVSADRTVTAVTDNDGYYEVLLAQGTVVSKAPDDGMFLYQNYPNPFNPSTVIPFSVSRTADVSLTIYNVLGQRVRLLAWGVHTAGRHSYTWDGRDDAGNHVSAGVYLYRLKAGRAVETGRMTLLDGGGSTGHAAGAYHARTAKTTGASSPVTWKMSVAAEGFVAFADTFIVYDGLSEGRKDVIMQRKGGISDILGNKLGCIIRGCWGDEDGSEINPPARFSCGFWEDGSYDSYALNEKGIFMQVPWSHATVDSVYLTITQSAYPERVNLTIPLVIHFWGDECPVISNMKVLSNGLFDTEITALIPQVVGKK